MKKLLELLATVNEYIAEQEDLRAEIQYVSQSGNIEIQFEMKENDPDGNFSYNVCVDFIQFDPTDNTIFLWNNFRQEYRLINGIDELKTVLNIMF